MGLVQSDLIRFTSEMFVVIPDEDEATNPGVFGKLLAEWIRSELAKRGVPAGEPVAEDFGWCVPVPIDGFKAFGLVREVLSGNEGIRALRIEAE